MQISGGSNSLVNIILSFLYLESCRCFKIDREIIDISDKSGSNCNGISLSFQEAQRCKCSITPESSIVSTDNGKITCVIGKNVDSSKYA